MISVLNEEGFFLRGRRTRGGTAIIAVSDS